MADLVKTYIENEKADADLAQKLITNDIGRLCTSGSMETDYRDFSDLGVREFVELNYTPLPQELKEQLRNLQTNCAFGIFPDIYRAWMIVDSDLFLWNFEFNKDLAYYDHIENTILKVDLVTLRQGSFNGRFSQALVVATTGDLYLLGVGFIDESRQETVCGQIDHKNPNLFLVLEEIAKISLDGVVVTDLASTSDGRIFFSADNDVYECDYFSERWFSSSVQKVNLTKSLFPNPLSLFQSKEKIMQLAVDDTRHILYSLTDHSKIVVYDLGNTGQSFSRVTDSSLDRIVKDNQYQISCDTAFVRELVSISVVSSTRSLYIYLEAITSFGIRIFFTCSDQFLVERGVNRFAQHSVRPKCLNAVHIRFPTGNPSVTLQEQKRVYYGNTLNGTTIMALSSAREESYVYAMSSVNFTYTQRLIESYNKLQVQNAMVWSASRTAERLALEQCKVRETAINVATMKEIELVPALQPPQFSQQHVFSVDKVHIVTPEGVLTVGHSAPVEILRQILEKYGTESRQLKDWLYIHGNIEVCIQALIIICSDQSTDLNIKEPAIRTFFSVGGQPELMSPPLSGRGQGDFFNAQSTLNFEETNHFMNQTGPLVSSTPRRALQQQKQVPASEMDMRPSFRHDALYTHFTRIVYYIWNRNVCQRRDNEILSYLYLEDLQLINKHIALFQQAIGQFNLISGVKGAGFQIDGEVIERENRSLDQLRQLIGITREFLNLWILLLEHNFTAVVGGLPSDVKEQILKWNFSELVANKPEQIGVELISALIKFYFGDEAKTENLNNRLASECPKLFTNEDANILKGIELLHTARNVNSSSERERAIHRAMEVMKKHAERADMILVANLLKDLNYYVGIIDMALARAKRVDPRDYAKIAYRKNLQELGDMQEAVEKRAGVYSIVIDTLNYLHGIATKDSKQNDGPLSKAAAVVERDQIIYRISHSDDEICQVYLFRWLIENGMEEKVLSEPNETLEHFIYNEIETSGATIYFDMLWQYYKGTEEYAKAAKLLYELATKKAKTTNTEKKLEFLSHALICINSAPESQPNVQLKANIRDWLDVARVQLQAQQQLKAEAGRRLDPSVVEETINELNSNLLTVSDLFELANRFDFPLIKLAVLHCAGHFDAEMVEGIYKNLIHEDLERVDTEGKDMYAAARSLATRLAQLRRQYAASPKYFPTKFIVQELLQYSLNSLSPKWFEQVIRGSEIQVHELITECLHVYRVVDPFWRRNSQAKKFMVQLCMLLSENFIQKAPQIVHEERLVTKDTCLEFVGTLLLDLQDSLENTDRLKSLQTRLEEIR
ncbi:unnamed protein product [Bursaphelenchus okinawaensis]|uniref:Nuclear pore complex protein Nup155 n=1 Tax=Bursaphelenchus okinawaensis TaxID=465554 RepID=A0A811KQX4_9BILA|nr:unnamed protein product [Bursaphelenchus okinawaensis]CAG9112093.1 unnamed protein product [Bursaphelenchus okinawaensis]